MTAVVGIDLGTTNTCVAVVEDGVAAVIPNRGGYKITPSIVSLPATPGGKRLVGHLAKRQAVTNAKNTIYAAKRLMGRKFDSPAAASVRQTAPYDVVAGPDGDARIRVGEQELTIPEISAQVLIEMKMVAEQYLSQPVEKAVVTVPAYFSDAQRQATRDAGRIAGLDVIRIINEPTAAALAYGFGRDLDRRVAVYDLGGGTFDISLLDIGKGVFEVLSTAGDTFLGGEDFDQRVMEWLVQNFRERHGADLHEDRMAMQRLKDAAEKARIELSTARDTLIDLPFLHTNATGETFHLQETITRDQLEELTRDLVERTIAICERTIASANIKRSDLDEVILVGGMTRMPMVQRRVSEFFELEPCKGVHPDEVVALGAAIQASALTDEESDIILLDVTPHNLGIMIVGGKLYTLIEQNTKVPTSATHVFTTTRDNQTQVKILVLQGVSELAAENEALGEFVLTGLRKAPRGQVEIEVTFTISADGIVSVSARDLETGHEQSITVTPNGGLQEEELQRLVDESAEYMVEVRVSEELTRARQKVERLIAEINDLFPRVEGVMSGTPFGRDAVAKARGVVDRAKSELSGTDVRAVTDNVETLERTLNMFRGVVSKTTG